MMNTLFLLMSPVNRDLLKWCERISLNFDSTSAAKAQHVFQEVGVFWCFQRGQQRCLYPSWKGHFTPNHPMSLIGTSSIFMKLGMFLHCDPTSLLKGQANWTSGSREMCPQSYGVLEKWAYLLFFQPQLIQEILSQFFTNFVSLAGLYSVT